MLLSLTTLSAFLAACSGGGGVQQTPIIIPASKSKGIVAVSIKIPARSAAASSRRRPQYVSASTESLAITISQSGTQVLQEAVSLTPSNPNCTSSAGATTCSLTFPLAPGSYLGTVSTYDGAVVGNAATGHLLSQGQSLAITVLGGQTNDLTLTLDGVPASIAIVPASGSLITGTQSGGFTVKYSAQPLLVNALDADGNTIVGPGAPTFTAMATATKFTVTNPTGGSPNQITLAGAAGGSGTLTVTAAPPDAGFSCATSGIVCVATVPISTPPHQLFTMTLSGLRVYTSPDDVTWTQTVNNTSATDSPATLDVAPNGTLAVVTSANPFAQPPVTSKIEIYSPPYTSAPAVNTNVTSPFNAVFTPSSTLLVGTVSNLVSLASPYSGSATSLANIGSQVTGIALDSSADAIVATATTASLYSAPAYSSGTSVDATTGYRVAVAANGDLAVGSEYPSNIITLYHSPYTSGSYATITLPNQGGPSSMAFDSNGGLWVLENPSHCLRYSAPFSTGQSPLFDVVNTGGYIGLATDASGDALVTDDNTATVTIINSSGTTVGTAGSGYYIKYVK
jgi:hypothetical protein